MKQRWLATGGLVEDRAHGPLIPSASAAWHAAVQKSVRAALRGDERSVGWGVELPYHTVRARPMELRRARWRVDQVLMAVKREVAAGAVAAITPDDDLNPTRIPPVLDAVVGLCVGAFYIGN